MSRAYFRKQLLTEGGMPTPRAKAAFRYLMQPLRKERRTADGEIEKELPSVYAIFLAKHAARIQAQENLNISSDDLFLEYGLSRH